MRLYRVTCATAGSRVVSVFALAPNGLRAIVDARTVILSRGGTWTARRARPTSLPGGTYLRRLAETFEGEAP